MDGKLSIKEVEVLLTDNRYAYISQGLQGGEKIVTTNLSTVAEGIPYAQKKIYYRAK